MAAELRGRCVDMLGGGEVEVNRNAEDRGTRGAIATPYRSFAYSALACFRMGMSGSASFQSVRKSL
jgi:hypothetical protein